MRLLCFMLKAGWEHPEMTVLRVMIVLFSFLSLEGIKIFHTAANLKITGAGKEARIFIFLPLNPWHLPLAASTGTGLCSSLVSYSQIGKTIGSGKGTELAEQTPGLLPSLLSKPCNCLQIKSYLFSIQQERKWLLILAKHGSLSHHRTVSYLLQGPICSAFHTHPQGPWDLREVALIVRQGSGTYRARTQLFSHKHPAKIGQIHLICKCNGKILP